MGFLKRLFGKSKKEIVPPSKEEDKYFNGPPIPGEERNIHIKRIENYRDGGKYAIFHFPDYTGDSFELEIRDDEFDQTRTLLPHVILSRKSDKVRLLGSNGLSELRIGMITDFTNHFLTIGTYQKESKLNIGDKVSLLFENGTIEVLEISEKGYRKDREEDGIVFESKIKITTDLIGLLSEQILTKWKLEDNVKNKSYISKLDSKYGWTNEKSQIWVLAKMIIIGIDELNPVTNTI